MKDDTREYWFSDLSQPMTDSNDQYVTVICSSITTSSHQPTAFGSEIVWVFVSLCVLL